MRASCKCMGRQWEIVPRWLFRCLHVHFLVHNAVSSYKSDRIQRLDGLKNELGVPIEFTRWPTLNFNLLETFKLITFPYTFVILYSPRLKLVSVERSSFSG